MDISTKDKKNTTGLAISIIGVLLTMVGEKLMNSGFSKLTYLTCSGIGIVLALCGVVIMSMVLAKD